MDKRSGVTPSLEPQMTARRKREEVNLGEGVSGDVETRRRRSRQQAAGSPRQRSILTKTPKKTCDDR